MRLINKFEKRFHWLRINQLSIILVVGYLLFFILEASGIINIQNLVLNFNMVFENNEYWRIFSFNFLISTRSFILIFLSLYCTWFFGATIEQTIGEPKFTLLFLVTVFSQILFAFIFPNSFTFTTVFPIVVFLAFAFLYPEYILYLLFIIPIKAKWLARITIATLIIYIFYSEFSQDSIAKLGSTLIPYLLFFGDDLYYRYRYKTRKVVYEQINQNAKSKHHHQCRVCNKTEISNPNLEFRYIENKNQVTCYCVDHMPSKH